MNIRRCGLVSSYFPGMDPNEIESKRSVIQWIFRQTVQLIGPQDW